MAGRLCADHARGEMPNAHTVYRSVDIFHANSWRGALQTQTFLVKTYLLSRPFNYRQEELTALMLPSLTHNPFTQARSDKPRLWPQAHQRKEKTRNILLILRFRNVCSRSTSIASIRYGQSCTSQCTLHSIIPTLHQAYQMSWHLQCSQLRPV